MSDPRTLETQYKNLSDRELLKLRAEGGFTAEAELLLSEELARRKLTLDEAKRQFAPDWLDEAGPGTVGVLVLEDGERITAEITELDAERDRLSVKVISPDGPARSGRQKHRAIP